MGIEVKDLGQQIIKFNDNQNFRYDDFYVSKSNEHVLNLINQWPKWQKNFLNLSGERSSGKTHLMNIFIEKFKGIKFEAQLFDNNDLRKIKVYQNIILENLDTNIDEQLFYTLINTIEQDNKYLIITSRKPIVDLLFKLKDLQSRTSNFILQTFEKPDDNLMFALILKNLSDRQIFLDKKLINYIVKRIERSYSNIFDFIYKIDEMSLKKKKSINLKIIKEALGE
tara:strand:+ start:750 stop:1424 length:675 start_codon:yes stop_codon:yes gene_type:complete